MKTTYAPFDVADYLDNDQVIAEYLTWPLKTPILMYLSLLLEMLQKLEEYLK